MKGYIVCVYKSISDESVLKKYAIKAKIAVDKYKGNFLVRGGKKITTEGEEFHRTVVIEFLSFELFWKNILSPFGCHTEASPPPVGLSAKS